MPITASPHFYNPQMAQITSNLATAIYGDPEARMKRDYYGSEVEKNQADARKLGSEADLAGGRYKAQQEMSPEAMQALAPLPGETPVQHTMRVAPLMSALARYGTGGKDAAEGAGSMLSNVFALGGDDDKRTALVMQGKMPNEDFSGTDARADTVLNTKGDQKYKTETGVANIKAGADLGVAKIKEGGENNRFFNAPVKTGAGETLRFAPTDPRYKSMGPKVEGAPNKATVEGAAGTRMLNGESSDTLQGLFTGKMGAGAGAKPRAVNARAMNDAVIAGLHGVNGAVDVTNPQRPFLSPEFESSFNPTIVKQARDAAAAELARSGDINRAGEAYATTLGVRGGDSFETQHNGFLGSTLFGATKGVTPAPAAAPAQAAQPAAPPVVSHPGQIPPPAARKVGMTITTPKGEMTWNGQGWVPAGPVN